MNDQANLTDFEARLADSIRSVYGVLGVLVKHAQDAGLSISIATIDDREPGATAKWQLGGGVIRVTKEL